MSVARPKIAVDRVNYAHVHGVNAHRVILLHSTEGHDRPGVSDVEGVLKYLEAKDYGVHWCVDGEGNIGRGAYHKDLVYHVKGANSICVGIEMIGIAAWTTKDWIWAGKTKRKQLETVAHLIAYISDDCDIPLVISKTNGLATHAMFPAGGHHDPGKGFPLGYVLKRARNIKAAARKAAARSATK